jgi:hypothetical protein
MDRWRGRRESRRVRGVKRQPLQLPVEMAPGRRVEGPYLPETSPLDKSEKPFRNPSRTSSSLPQPPKPGEMHLFPHNTSRLAELLPQIALR